MLCCHLNSISSSWIQWCTLTRSFAILIIRALKETVSAACQRWSSFLALQTQHCGQGKSSWPWIGCTLDLLCFRYLLGVYFRRVELSHVLVFTLDGKSWRLELARRTQEVGPTRGTISEGRI